MFLWTPERTSHLLAPSTSLITSRANGNSSGWRLLICSTEIRMPYALSLYDDRSLIHTWLQAISSRDQSGVFGSTVFSKFVYENNCSLEKNIVFMELLVGDSRHPHAIPDCVKIFTTPPPSWRQELLAHQWNGSNRWSPSPSFPLFYRNILAYMYRFSTGLQWFTSAYKTRGIVCDEIWALEVKQLAPDEYWKVRVTRAGKYRELPLLPEGKHIWRAAYIKELNWMVWSRCLRKKSQQFDGSIHKIDNAFLTISSLCALKKIPAAYLGSLHFYYIPASATPDERNPLAIVKQKFRPGDFVVLKLDIDNSPLELSLVKQIQSNPYSKDMISEMMFEMQYSSQHVNQWFGPSDQGWKDVLLTFSALRKAGIRVLYWP